MQLYRISALFRRYFFFSTFEILRLVDILYWPIFDIVLWGFTSVWMQRFAQTRSISLILLTGLVFWQVIMRSLMEISMTFLEELWSQNLINLFATPVCFSEWIVAVLLLSCVKSLFALGFGALVVWLIYGVSIFATGWVLAPMFLLLLVSGWSFGCLSVSLLLITGQRAQSLVWIICWFFAPFSGVFYPIATLPSWAQTISYALPMTYIFEGIRSIILNGTMPDASWYRALLLTAVYVACALTLCFSLFRRAKIQGLARLQID